MFVCLIFFFFFKLKWYSVVIIRRETAPGWKHFPNRRPSSLDCVWLDQINSLRKQKKQKKIHVNIVCKRGKKNTAEQRGKKKFVSFLLDSLSNSNSCAVCLQRTGSIYSSTGLIFLFKRVTSSQVINSPINANESNLPSWVITGKLVELLYTIMTWNWIQDLIEYT